MRLLLDTQVFIWLLTDHDRISRRAADPMANLSNELLLSSASIWEMAIKVGLGKLDLQLPLAKFVERGLADVRINALPVTIGHAIQVASLEAFHRDPFDRLLVAQAQVESLTLVSADRVLSRYAVDLLW